MALAAGLTACQQDVRLDTTTADRFATSIAEASRLRPQDAAELADAAARFKAAYFGSHPVATAPPKASTQTLWASELPGFVNRHLTVQPQVETPPTFPNPWLAEQIRAGYQAQYDLLSRQRQRAAKVALFTVDQYEITDFVLIPPTENLSLADDKVRFIVTLTNHTNLDANQPTFHVRVTVEGEPYPRLDRAFELTPLKTPLAAGETRRIAFSCCSLAGDAYYNKRLRTLPSHANVEISLTQMLDTKRRQLFDRSLYSLTDHNRREQAKACVDYLDARLKTWVPGQADDPCNALAPAFDPDPAKRVTTTTGA